MSRVNKTRFAILGCISIKPMSAYDIKMFMARSTAYFWMESESQLYPTLKQLNKDGYIDFTEEKAQKAGTRKIYNITQTGLELLQEWLMQKTSRAPYRSEFLLKLFFGNHVADEVTLQRIDSLKTELKEEFAIYQNIYHNMEQREPFDRKRFILATLLSGIRSVEANILWCDEAKALLSQD
jgi:DNA-binding PadR family transcriptional regulator